MILRAAIEFPDLSALIAWIIHEADEKDGKTMHQRWKRGREFSPP
jgi:hypothetical protein